MLVITTKKLLYYNYDKDTWHKELEKASVFENFELDVLIELIKNQSFDLEVRDTAGTVLCTNYIEAEIVNAFLS